MSISGEQFSMLPGPTQDQEYDASVRQQQQRRTEDSTAPPDYYRQGRAEQLALPGMEMSIHDHIAALEEHTGGTVIYHHDPARDVHGIAISDNPVSDWDVAMATGASNLTWQGHTGRSHEPGEIHMVYGEQVGEARAMHATARRIAEENASTIPTPRHSTHRTRNGLQWSRKEMKKYGEQVW